MGKLIIIEDPLLSAHGHQFLPLATSQLWGDDRELNVSGIFWSTFAYYFWKKLIAIVDPSLIAHGYQLLPQQPVSGW